MKARDHLGDPGVDGRILKELGGKDWVLHAFEQGSAAGCCEHGNKHSSSTESKFLDYPSVLMVYEGL
jgi:hypothetical protein